jgi:S1-C subfamily serine protease
MKAAPLLLALLCLAAVSGKDQNPPVLVEDKIVVLEPLKIQGSPIISFAIDITVYADPKTRKVDRIFIARVLPDTDAEKAGLQKGDEIVKLDGVAVKDFDAVVSLESPLGRILLNRFPGEALKMEVIARRPQSFTLRAQRPPLILP